MPKKVYKYKFDKYCEAGVNLERTFNSIKEAQEVLGMNKYQIRKLLDWGKKYKGWWYSTQNPIQTWKKQRRTYTLHHRTFYY